MRLGLDPGHGGTDCGASYDGLVESTLNLDLAARIAHALPRADVECTLSRWNAETVSFTERALRLAECDWVLSIHHNASPRADIGGVEVYLLPGHSLAELAVAEHLIDAFPRELVSRSSRVVEADPADAMWLQNPHNVLRRHNQPKLLLEVCYLSHDGDREVLRSEWGRVSVLGAVVCAVGTMARACS